MKMRVAVVVVLMVAAGAAWGQAGTACRQHNPAETVPFDQWAYGEAQARDQAPTAIPLRFHLDFYLGPLRLLREEGTPSQPELLPFPDVPPDHWAAAAVYRLWALGILEGYPGGEFGGE